MRSAQGRGKPSDRQLILVPLSWMGQVILTSIHLKPHLGLGLGLESHRLEMEKDCPVPCRHLTVVQKKKEKERKYLTESHSTAPMNSILENNTKSEPEICSHKGLHI